MKLAEALLVRSDTQKKLASLRQRIVNNAVVQEGSDPHEDPVKLTKEAFAVMKQLEALVLQVNAANHANSIDDGQSLAAAIAQRETLAAKHALLMQAIAGSHKEPDRYSMSEIKWISTMDIAALQRDADNLSKQIRELNVKIQARNWEIDIA